MVVINFSPWIPPSNIFRRFVNSSSNSFRSMNSNAVSIQPSQNTSKRFATLSTYYKHKQQYLQDMNPEINFRKHSWDTGQNYCTLCNEPFETYNQHRGKREHMTIELFFEIICEYARDWHPKDVLRQAFPQEEKNNENSSATSVSPAFLPFQSLLDYFENNERIERKNRTHAIAKYFVERGVLFPGPKQWSHMLIQPLEAGRAGELVMYEWVHPPIQKLMPHAIAGQISAFSQQVTGFYNLGTTFDFLGFGDLIDPRDLPNYVGLGDSNNNHVFNNKNSENNSVNETGSTLSTTSNGRLKPANKEQRSLFQNNAHSLLEQHLSANDNQKCANKNNNLQHLLEKEKGTEISLDGPNINPMDKFSSRVEVMYWHKGIILRHMLGQLRWCMETCAIPQCWSSVGGKLFEEEPEMVVLGEELVHGIIQEAVFLRLAEYVTRAEYAWKQLGCPVYDNNQFMEMYTQSQARIGHDVQKLNELQRLKRNAAQTVMKTNDPMFAAKVKAGGGGGGNGNMMSSPKITKKFHPQGKHVNSVNSLSVGHEDENDELTSKMIKQRQLSSLATSSIYDRCSNVAKNSAVDKVLEIIQGSCHDGVAAVLGETKGMSNFASGGSAWNKLSSHPSSDFLGNISQDHQKRIKHQEMIRNSVVRELAFVAEQKQRLEENFEQRMKTINEKKHQTTEQDASSNEKNVKKPSYPRKPGANMSATAERLFSDAACGTKYCQVRSNGRD